MLRFRPFRNDDPPHLAEIWRSQPPQRALAQPVSASILEQSIFSKTIFDPEGLIVATQDGRPLGFVHAGFGPTEDESRISTELGVICMLMVRCDGADHVQSNTLAKDLLIHSEDYLHQRGAQVLYAGGIRPLNPFYLGLYGGSELPGILDSDTSKQAFFIENRYQEIDRVIIQHCDLAGFRPKISRQQLDVRRRMEVSVTYDPPTPSWWQALTVGNFERTRFELRPRGGESVLATATFWSIEPLAISWGAPASGLFQMDVDPAHRRLGLATYLLGEALRELSNHGVTLVEAQTMQHNTAALALYRRLGFTEVDQGAVLRKAS